MNKYIIISIVVMVIMVMIQMLCLYMYILKTNKDFTFKQWYKSGFYNAFKREKLLKKKTKRVRFDEIIKIK